MRWELIPYQHNPMSLVHVKDSSKRQREPKALSADEFRKVLESIFEPFRTMCIVAMCLGLRVSEILGLRWREIDWDGLRLAVRRAYVYGKQGDVKTQASHRWMPRDRSLAEKLFQHKTRLAPLRASRPHNVKTQSFLLALAKLSALTAHACGFAFALARLALKRPALPNEFLRPHIGSGFGPAHGPRRYGQAAK